MTKNGEHFVHQRARIALAFAGLLLAMAGISLSEPLLTLSKTSYDEISMFLPVHGYVFFLVPLTFYINMLLLLHLLVPSAASEAPLSVFINKHLPQAAHSVSLANLMLCAPLSLHVSVAEKSVGFAIGDALAVLALVTIITSALKKIIMSSSHAGRGFMPAFFALCISTGTMISFDPMLCSSNKNHRYFLCPLIPIHLMLSFSSFFTFIFTIILLLICIGTSTGRSRVTIHVQNSVIAALSIAIATLLVGWYMRFYMSVTGMGSVPVKVTELL